MVSELAVKNGVMMFFEHEMCEKASGIGRFTSYFFLPSVPVLVEKKMQQVKESGLMDDVFVGGMVDIDAVERRARDAMEKVGCIELMGYRLSQADVEEMAEYIRHA